MERAIATITNYITKCTECSLGKEYKCSFLLLDGEVPSEKNNPYMEDGVMELSSEQRAFIFMPRRGNHCGEQINFEQFLRKLEQQLEDVEIPANSAELLRLIAKINRIYSIVQRSSYDLSFAFGDIAMASMDKCLARIDYYYLEKAIDIVSAIKSVSPDYNRVQALGGMYPPKIVESYIKKATILEINDLTVENRQITGIAADVKRLNKQLPVACDDLPLGVRTLGFSAIKEFKWIFSNEYNIKLIRVLLSEFGYPLIAEIDPMHHEGVLPLVKNNPDQELAVFIRWKELNQEIDDLLSRNMKDPIQSFKYLQTLIGSTKEIANLYYPVEETEDRMEAATLLHFLSSVHVKSYRQLINIWHESCQEARDRKKNEDLSFAMYLDILKRIAIDKAYEEGCTTSNNEFTILNALYTNMKFLAINIERCLLRKWYSLTVKDLQDECGVKISEPVTDNDLVINDDMSLDEIKACRSFIELFDTPIEKEAADNLPLDNTPGIQAENEDAEESYSPYPSIAIDIIKYCDSVYQINGDSIIFNGTRFKNYAIFLKELYRMVYNEKGDFNVQWNMIPIHPMKNGVVPTHAQLSNGLRNYNVYKDCAIMERYKKVLNDALAVIRHK